MKKRITTITGMAMIYSVAFGQTLTQSTHAPAVGDNYSFQYADPSTLPANLGIPGPGNVFNFSLLSVYPGSNLSQGVTPASTGSASAYPSANVAVKTGTNNTFYNSQSNQLEFYGGSITAGGYAVTLNYSIPAKLAIYPMSLGTSGSGTVAGTGTILGNSGNFTGNVSFTANATGTLIVPGGVSYNNVIRVQTQQNTTFTLTSGPQGTIIINQYDYYAPSYSNLPNPNNNWPVISVQQSTINLMFGTSVQTTVTINSNYQTLNVTNSMYNNSSQVFIFPNPANDYVTIHTNNLSSIKRIQLIDITGKVLYETTQNHINCSNFANGVYFIRVEEHNGRVVTKKFVIQD